MITAYSPDSQDWSNNGLGILMPTVCAVKEDAGGDYSLEIEHPLDDGLRWQMLQRGYLVKAPVPERETPLIQQSAEARTESPEHIIWEVTAATGSVYSKASSGYSAWSSLATYSKGAKRNYNGKSYRWGSEIDGNITPPSAPWVKITTGSKRLKKLPLGTEVIYHEDDDSWSKITTPDGTTGYILKSSIAYKRTEPFLSAQPAYNTAVPPRQIREQVFRIYDVQVDDKANVVKASARHIHYDQLRNLIKSYNPGAASLQSALVAMSADCLNDHDFNYYTNIDAEITAEWARKNVISAIHDPDNGAVPKTQAQLVRDNYDTFLLQNVERDRGVVIEYGKNLLGITSTVNDESVVTRIMPIGYDAEGKPMLLPEYCVDSPYIGEYATERAVTLDVQEAKVHDADGDDPGMTLEQAYTKMRDAAQAEFDKGCDLADIEITVDFIHLGDTEEYKQYKNLQQVFLYDTVTVRHGRIGLDYKTQVVGYEFDAILGRYTKISLGSIKSGADLGAVAGFQLPSMGISGTKLVPGSVGSSQLQRLAVLNAHIANLSVNAAKIQDAAIETAKIKDAAVTNAKIADATIEDAKIKDATITNAKIADATIENGKIKDATITNAKIASAGIDFAKIKDLIADTAIITEGIGGKLLIERLSVAEANIANLAVGKLMFKDDTGAFYELGVDGEGSVTATLVQVSNDNVADVSLNAGEKLIHGSIVAQCLDVAEIFANEALVGAVKAGNIEAGAIETTHISAPTQAALTLMATNAIKDRGMNMYSVYSELSASGSGHVFSRDETINGLYIKSTEAVPSGAFRIGKVITGNGEWTVSFFIRGNDSMGSSYCLNVDACDAPQQRVYLPETPGEWKYVAYTFTVDNYSSEVYNFVDLSTQQWAEFWIKDLMIERGSKASLRSPSPLDPAPGVKTSYIQIFEDVLRLITGGTLVAEGATFDIATDLFTIQNLAKTKIMLELANGRLGGDIAVFTHTISDVPNTFPGGTIPWAGSFQASLNNIGKWLLAESTLTVSGNITEDVTVPVFVGARLKIKLASGAKITGRITFDNCANVYMYADAQNTTNIIGTGTDHVIILNSSNVDMENLHISGKVRTSAADGTAYGIRCNKASTLTAKGCTVDRTNSIAMLGDSNSKIDVYQCKGGVSGGDYTTLANLGWGIYVQRNADVSLYDTIPFGASGGAGFWIGEIRGTATNTPTDGTTPPAPSVRTYAVSAGHTAKSTASGGSSVSWGSGEPRQGSWTEYIDHPTPLGNSYIEVVQYYGFGLFLLTNAANIVSDRPVGKTIVSAKMKIRRDADAGTSGAISCTLHQHNLTSAPSGAPNTVLFAQAADAVNISPNQEMTIPLNASAITNLNNGTCKGFGFKSAGGYGRYDVFGELEVTYG